MATTAFENTSSINLVAVVPTYNERENLPILAERLMALAGVRLLVVDDASPDGTGDIADDLSRRWPGRIVVMHRHGQRGLGRAYVDGLRAALDMGSALVCQMDADLSHDPVFLPDLAAAAEDSDLVIGSRYVIGVSVINWPVRRILLSYGANRYIRALTALRIRDCTGGYRCWRREALARLPLDQIRSDGYAFMVETLYEAARRGGRICEVPIIFVERRAGSSKVSRRVLIESLTAPWRLVARDLRENGAFEVIRRRTRRRATGRPAAMREPEIAVAALSDAVPSLGTPRVLLRYR